MRIAWSTLSYDDNVARTRAVTQRCHAADCWVEAELGAIGGKDGAHAPGVRTDPGEAVLDNDLIASPAKAVPVPLVLHGSSGVPGDGIRDASFDLIRLRDARQRQIAKGCLPAVEADLGGIRRR